MSEKEEEKQEEQPPPNKKFKSEKEEGKDETTNEELEKHWRILEGMIKSLILVMDLTLRRVKVYMDEEWNSAGVEANKNFLDDIAEGMSLSLRARGSLLDSGQWKMEEEHGWEHGQSFKSVEWI
jgi:hypothetical protein